MTTTFRRSGSFQPAAAPSTGEILSSSNGGNNTNGYPRRDRRPRRRRKAPQNKGAVNGWAFILTVLLLIVAFLSVLDVVLFYKHKHHSKNSALEEPPSHLLVERKPPRAVKGDGDDATLSEEDNNMMEDVDYDKEPIYEILRQARIDPSTLTKEQKRRLPTWSTVQRLYGDSPKMYGLDTCERFREITEPSLTFLAMAGTFNSGTNLLASLMIQNCQIDERMKTYGEKQKGMRWQVKWVRHFVLCIACVHCLLRFVVHIALAYSPHS